MCEEWVSALRSAIKGASNPKSKINRRASFRSAVPADEDDDEATSVEVTVSLVSLCTSGSELVIARLPQWDRLISVSNVRPGDQLIISTSNGGVVVLSSNFLELRAEDGVNFETAVQSVTLSSSLRITVQPSMRNRHHAGGDGGGAAGAGAGGVTGSVSTLLARLSTVAIQLSSNRSNSMRLVLCLMVLCVGLSSLGCIDRHTSYYFLLTLVLAAVDIQGMMEASQSRRLSANGVDYMVAIHGHAFTSPDAPINAPEDEVPKRFLDGCDGDLKEASRRWDVTRHWRESEVLGTSTLAHHSCCISKSHVLFFLQRVNTILEEPQPHFFALKAMYPHYHSGRGKLGHLVYYERPGEIELPQLFARGITIDDICRHWLFVTEYQWQVMLGETLCYSCCDR